MNITTLYILSKLITLVVVPVNYHYVPIYLIFNSNGINYKFWGVTPKCLFSCDVISGSNAITRLRSQRYPICCRVTINTGFHSRSRYLRFRPLQAHIIVNFNF